MKCWNCGTEFEGNFCPSCGKQEKDKIEHKVCPKCKAEVAGSAKFCNNCGYTFKETNGGVGPLFGKIDSIISSFIKWCKTNIKTLIYIASALAIIGIIVISAIISGNIFRAGKVEAISIGDTKAQVEKVLGKPDDDSNGIWTYYDNDYKKLDAQSEEYGKAMFEAETEKEAENAFEKISEIDEKMQTGIFKQITVRFDSGEIVEEVALNKQYKIEGGIKKTPKKIKFNEISVIEAIGCAGAVAKVYYTDGSYRSKYYFFSKVTFNGEEISNRQITNIGNYQVTISDSWGEYSAEIEIEELKSLDSLNFTTQLDGVKYSGTKEQPYLICTGTTDKNITTVSIHSSCIAIKDGAFEHCNKLISLTIPDSVTSIGNKAFNDCPIVTATIPAMAGYYIKNSAQTVVITSGKSIGDRDFYYSDSLTEVVIGNSVTSIGDSAFEDCDSLTEVVIPDSVTSIGDSAFEDCNILTIYCEAASKPSGWNSNWNYSDCPVVWNCNNNDIADDGYIYTVIDGVRYQLKDGVATVVRQPRNITTANIPSSVTYKNQSYSVTSIGYGAFSGCDSLTEIVIPDSVTSIGDSAFSGCDSLTEVVIGNSVTSIGQSAFLDCSNLTRVYISDIAKWCNITFGSYTSNPFSNGANLYLNNELVTRLEIPSGVTRIGDGAFEYCDSLTEVVIPDSVTSIESGAFSGCSSLTEAVIGNGVTGIGYGAFSNCSSLTEVVIPDSVTSIGDWAFSGCYSLTEVVIGDSVTSIGACAFSYCESLTEIVIPDSVTSIESSAFSDCESLTEVVIPDSVTSIGGWAFYNCDSLTKINYKGTQEQWNNINIGNSDSFPISANIVYNYQGD